MKPSRLVGVALAIAAILPLASRVVPAQTPGVVRAEKVVTEADNGSSVTLNAGEVLVVRLPENPSTGYSRAVVSFPQMPVRLISHQVVAKAPAGGGVPMVGAPRVGEWRFEVAGESATSRAVWLKILNLRPFAKGVDTEGLWEVQVTVPPTASK